MAQRADCGGGVLQQRLLEGGIGPPLATTRAPLRGPDLGLVGLDDGVECRGRCSPSRSEWFPARVRAAGSRTVPSARGDDRGHGRPWDGPRVYTGAVIVAEATRRSRRCRLVLDRKKTRGDDDVLDRECGSQRPAGRHRLHQLRDAERSRRAQPPGATARARSSAPPRVVSTASGSRPSTPTPIAACPRRWPSSSIRSRPPGLLMDDTSTRIAARTRRASTSSAQHQPYW